MQVLCVAHVVPAGTGKSSLITALVKDTFISTKLQPVLPIITKPPDNFSTATVTIVDTSALPQERNTLRKEIRRSNVILLLYSDDYSCERVSLFWLPFFRSLGVNIPVILCATKTDLLNAHPEDLHAEDGFGADLSDSEQDEAELQRIEEEMMPIMQEFKEIDSCIRVSAKVKKNVTEVFYLCQRAVTHPIAPLFDSKEQCMKPAAIASLQRIFCKSPYRFLVSWILIVNSSLRQRPRWLFKRH